MIKKGKRSWGNTIQNGGTGRRLDNATETLRMLRSDEDESFSSKVWERRQMCERAHRTHVHIDTPLYAARASHPQGVSCLNVPDLVKDAVNHK